MGTTPVPEQDSRAWTADEVLEGQREANEMLVLAALQGVEREGALNATAELRERLIGIIAHDLRTPLNTILLGAGMVLSRAEPSSPDAILLQRVVRSGERMARMITQILDFTRVRMGGSFPLTVARCDLGDICANISEELRIASTTEIHLTREGDLIGVWDADRLAQAISNIAGNAADHSSPGAAVELRVHAEGEWVVAEITNLGICIPADALPSIFDAFRGANERHRAHNTAGHLGLGLYIAHEIVLAHRGMLGVRSSDGSTTFTLRLPRS
jgi:sigma-B regulation protein RsbU (phosphoserine phosphatase)